MAATGSLPFTSAVDVVVMVSPQTPATPTFNQGLIIGTSPVIGSVIGNNPRIRQYTSLAQILTDGFSISSPEYIAASIYFGQSPAPTYLNIGRQDLTALKTVNVHVGNAGTGYVIGDIVTVNQSNASLGQVQVTAIGTNGAVTTVVPVLGNAGTGYADASALTTTAIIGVGTGLQVDVTAIGETPLQAVQACRLASAAWYPVVSLTAQDADNIAIGEWIQAQTPQSMYMYTTSNTGILNGVTGNVFATLKAGNYSRSFGIYSTTQNGLYPNNIYSAVAAMGVAMGLNTGLAGSYFTLKFKQLVGIATEPLTVTQYNQIASQNGNAYVNVGNAYNWLQESVMADGSFFDQILNLDMVASDIQYSVLDTLIANNSIPQTNAGQTTLLNAVNAACNRAASRGFIAGNIWSGPTILKLTTGTAIPNGYLAQSDIYANQATADRDARKAMPVYVALCQAGAVHSILIGVYVQQ